MKNTRIAQPSVWFKQLFYCRLVRTESSTNRMKLMTVRTMYEKLKMPLV